MQHLTVPNDSEWAWLRESEAMAMGSVSNTGMACTIDLGDQVDIHPPEKDIVGYRMALSARATAYHDNIVYSGPVFATMTVTGSSVTVRFSHIGSGLAFSPGIDGELKGFSLCGPDRMFRWAKAAISSNTVVLYSDTIANPEAVRYGWANYPECNLTNIEGLPAVPFRTDG
jgi:sialate O-acetylesterase